eukprot:358703-Chlamydomonas_euryale.AAC.4
MKTLVRTKLEYCKKRQHDRPRRCGAVWRGGIRQHSRLHGMAGQFHEDRSGPKFRSLTGEADPKLNKFTDGGGFTGGKLDMAQCMERQKERLRFRMTRITEREKPYKLNRP